MAEKMVQLEKGVAYRGRVIVFSPLGMGVTEDKVKDGFGKAGFSDTRAWLEESDLPSDWPQSTRADVAPAEYTQAWVEATWNKDSGSYPAGGHLWELYDYWPKDSIQPTPVKVNEPKGVPLWAYAAGIGALGTLVLVIATRGD